MQVSRIPGEYDYEPESHAGNRKRERNISMPAIDHIIENGDAKEGKKGRVNLEGTWSGMTITVVVNPKTNYIVTTFYGTSKTGKALEEAQVKRQSETSAYRKAWR